MADRITDCRAVVPKFAAYVDRVGRAWGCLHVAFSDGNWHCELSFVEPENDEERELLAIYAQLSQTQRRKVRDLAEQYRG